jgi:taurine transport system permease protein
MADTDAGLPEVQLSRPAAGVSPSRSAPRIGASRLISLATVSVLLGGWWLATYLVLLPPLFLPSPEMVLRQAERVATAGFVDATLSQHLLASLRRIFAALALAIATAVPAGLAVGLNPVARGFLDPIIEFYRPIPPLAYLPLIVIWFGIGEFSKILLIYLAAFAPIAIATAAGVRGVSPDRVNAARSLGASSAQVVRLVVLPSALPDILTGVRIGLGAGWSTLVAAELVAATRGLGFMVQSAAQFLVTDVVVMGIFVIALVAFALELAIRLLQKLLVPWQGRH